MIRILVADDHAVIRRGIRYIVSREGEMSVIGEPANGRELLALAATIEHDLILLDLSMPDSDGLEPRADLREDADEEPRHARRLRRPPPLGRLTPFYSFSSFIALARTIRSRSAAGRCDRSTSACGSSPRSACRSARAPSRMAPAANARGRSIRPGLRASALARDPWRWPLWRRPRAHKRASIDRRSTPRGVPLSHRGAPSPAGLHSARSVRCGPVRRRQVVQERSRRFR